MFAKMFKLCVAVTLLLMVVPAVGMIQGLLAGRADPKFVGGTVLNLAVMVVLALLLPFGGARPGLALSVLGGCGVMVFATAWLFGDPGQFLLTVAAIVMFAISLWAAVTKVDRMRDESRSHFAR
jgi:hypothetical protein